MSWKHVNARRSAAKTDAQYIERMKELCDFPPSGCWLYRGFVHKNGYGDMCYRGKNRRVHRLSYLLHKGEIPAGMDVCHTCDVRNCVNPLNRRSAVHTQFPPVLDACCGSRMMWFDKRDGRALFIDNRRETHLT